ncbi:MAG: glycosyltransferase family 39 protein [Anaerolineae bacterium]|nr:glycosyltransferase family 39 protein [Anaerolineae bacterium]
MSVTDNDNPSAADPVGAESRPAARHKRTIIVTILLLAVLALAGWFRFNGVRWDSDSHLHPDERFLTDLASNLHSVESPLDYFRTSVSTLNPYNVGRTFYVYGNFPMTATRYAAEWATDLCVAATARNSTPPRWCPYTFTAYDGIHVMGRFLAALADMVTVLFTFLIGRRLYGKGAGLIAAFLMGVAVMPIQQSHFFTMDTWAVMFTTLAIHAAVRAATLGDPEPRFRWRWWAVFGLFLGLAVASRINMAPLALVIGVSAVIFVARTRYIAGEREHQGSRTALNSSLVTRHSSLAVFGIVLAAVVSMITVRVAQPYAFMDAQMVRQTALAETGVEPSSLVVAIKSIIGLNPMFLTNMKDIQRQQAPEALFPPAIQWVDRPAILFPLSNMILWGMGLTAGVFAWLALLWAIWRMINSNTRYGIRDTKEETEGVSRISYFVSPEWMLHAIPVFWTLLYFLYMGTRWVKSVRYFLPIYPTLFVLAGWALVYLWRRAGERERRGEGEKGSGGATRGGFVSRISYLVSGKWAVGLLALVVLIPSFLWAVTFTRIYREPMTRIAASDWIFANVPSGATLLYDTADGTTRELQLPLKGMRFEYGGSPIFLDFKLPEDGVVRAVRFNYLTAADFDPAAPPVAQSLRVRINDGETVEYPLTLDDQRRAVMVELPPVAVPAGQAALLTAEAGPGGPINAGTSLLVNEHWDDLLPANTGGRNAYGSYYTEVSGGQRPVTHPDSPEKREEMIAWLDESDYIMISSQRAIWNLPRMPLTYPLMMKYYESLFNGALGFDLVAQFNEDTRLGPLYISDTTAQLGWGEQPAIGWPPPGELAAEEAFSVYDHPPVWIFRKNDRYDSQAARALLESVDLSNVIVQNPLEATEARNGLMLSATDAAAQQAGGTFSEVFNIDGALSQRPWLGALFWMATLVLLGWAAFPLAFVALRGLPDRGYALSRVLGLLVISWLPWLAASLKLLPFTQGTILLALVLLVVVSIILFIRNRAEMLGFLSRRWTYIVLVELLAVGLFLLMIAIRLGNPDVWDVIWGGEKPMDLSYFTAVMRSTTFPPYDPWHAGGYINYYYYGFVFLGALTKLLGIVPAVAYNLALPTLFSMTGLGVFGIAWSLVTANAEPAGATADGAPADVRPVGSFRSLVAEMRSRAAVAGFVAVALALLLGNLAQVTVITNAWHNSGSESLEALPLIGGVARTLDGGLKLLGGKPAPMYPGDWFWIASRAINADPGEVQPITEFPYFTFLYGDLHAHMIAMPLQMLALGWAAGVVLLAGKKRKYESRTEGGASKFVTRHSSLVTFFIGSLAIGALRPTNTWDWPTYLLLGSLAVAYYALHTGGYTWRSAGRAALAVLALAGLSSLLFLPFTANYGSAYSSVSLWKGSYTHPWNYLLVHGLFLFFVITHLAIEFRDWTTSWTEAGKARLEPYGWLIMLGMAAFVGALALLLLRGYRVGPIALPLLVVAGLLALRPGLPEARRIVLALMSAAIGLTLIVEIVVLDGDIGRMNTVFKFYLQVWLMLSVACGAAAVWVWPVIGQRRRLRTVWKAALGVLVFAALLYPLTATPAKWGIRMSKEAPHTLDGAAFLDYVEYGDTRYDGSGVTIRPGDDLGAIDWLQRNVTGTPVIMEAHGGNPYRSIAARISMYTGLPSVIGWDWHQRQQRAVTPGSAVTNRIEDVNNFYNTPDTATARNILAKYGVEYIVLGSLENAYYWPQGLAKFDQMIADGTLTEVYRDATARILRVTSDE